MATTMLAALQTIQKEVDSSLKYKKVYKHVIWKIKYDHRIDLKTLKEVIFDSIRQELGQDKLTSMTPLLTRAFKSAKF